MRAFSAIVTVKSIAIMQKSERFVWHPQQLNFIFHYDFDNPPTGSTMVTPRDGGGKTTGGVGTTVGMMRNRPSDWSTMVNHHT